MSNSNHLCHQCRGELAAEFDFNPGLDVRPFFVPQLHPATEMELAMELFSVSSEAELDHFLGKFLKKAWGGLKKVGSFVGKIAKPFAGALKGLAKAALPFVGKALGTMIPIPGVGTAVGGMLGSALSKALEMEFGHLEQSEGELEMARRFVRIAHTASTQLASTPPGNAGLQPAIERALKNAIGQTMPNVNTHTRGAASIAKDGFGFGASGSWRREGGNIVLEW